ncbi:MAG TPA: VWA domain-containing protein [Vicinamibacterales bacterium]|nr:VWA domain-containing protein [Vicinamibacterales bacterium]
MTKKLFVCGAAVMALAVQGVSGQGQAPPQPPQQPPVTFRAEVNYVEVDARVLDRDGKFISGLQAADFQVFEDGKPQKVTAFSLVNIPLERVERPLFASKPVERDVRTNLEAADGRIYVIVLDDLHTAPLRSQRIKLAARQFIERYVGANDIAAVVHTSGRTDAGQEFTTSQARLLRAVDKFMGRKLRSSTMNMIDDVQRRAGTPFAGDPAADMDDKERGFQARNTLDSIRNLANYLGNIRGRRKALVMFGEGIDYDVNQVMSDQITEAQTVMDATREMIAAATRANMAIYAVDPRGLGAEFEDLAAIQSFPDDTSSGLGMGSIFNEVRLGQDSLRVMSEETGGFAVVNRNDFASAFQRIVDDNSSYYVMGYYSSNDRRDGRFRKIEVRLPDKPGYVIRSRKGYVAPRGRAPETKTTAKDGPTPELRDAMESPLPLAGLPLSVTASVFKGPTVKGKQPLGSVVISTLILGSTLPFAESEGMFKNDIEVLGIATDDKGKSFSTPRNTVNLNMKPDTAKRVTATGFRVINSIDLAPGRYNLRVAVREANTRKAGSVMFDVEVPEFANSKLTMSDIALTSAMSGVAPTIRPKDPLEKLLPGPLTTYREFAAADELALFAEIYDNVTESHKVEINATVKAEGGTTVYSTREERDSADLKGSAGGFGFEARIPLKSLAPGLYVLRVDATMRINDRPTTSREIIFRVAGQ